MNQEQLHYRVTGDAKGFKGAINQSQKSLNGFQQQIKSVASNLKLLMSGALVAAGIQAVRSAKTFDKSMTQIKSLVGVASAEVDKMAESVKDLARDTGISANEAGEALFFITSALFIMPPKKVQSFIYSCRIKLHTDAYRCDIGGYQLLT